MKPYEPINDRLYPFWWAWLHTNFDGDTLDTQLLNVRAQQGIASNRRKLEDPTKLNNDVYNQNIDYWRGKIKPVEPETKYIQPIKDGVPIGALQLHLREPTQPYMVPGHNVGEYGVDFSLILGEEPLKQQLEEVKPVNLEFASLEFTIRHVLEGGVPPYYAVLLASDEHSNVYVGVPARDEEKITVDSFYIVPMDETDTITRIANGHVYKGERGLELLTHAYIPESLGMGVDLMVVPVGETTSEILEEVAPLSHALNHRKDLERVSKRLQPEPVLR